MINYWQQQVIQNYLPPIDQRKKQEMLQLRKQATTVSHGNRKMREQVSRDGLLPGDIETQTHR